MTFRPELAQAVLAGRKWITRRAVSDNPRSPYHPDRAPGLWGKRIAICPGRGKAAIGSARVAAVYRETFAPAQVNYAQAWSEGFVSQAAFMGAWESIHGNLDLVDVWRIELRDPEPA